MNSFAFLYAAFPIIYKMTKFTKKTVKNITYIYFMIFVQMLTILSSRYIVTVLNTDKFSDLSLILTMVLAVIAGPGLIFPVLFLSSEPNQVHFTKFFVVITEILVFIGFFIAMLPVLQ